MDFETGREIIPRIIQSVRKIGYELDHSGGWSTDEEITP